MYYAPSYPTWHFYVWIFPSRIVLKNFSLIWRTGLKKRFIFWHVYFYQESSQLSNFPEKTRYVLKELYILYFFTCSFSITVIESLYINCQKSKLWSLRTEIHRIACISLSLYLHRIWPWKLIAFFIIKQTCGLLHIAF